MTQPSHDVTSARQRSRQYGRVAMIVLLLVLLAAQSGCQFLRQRLREQERLFALETARTQTQRGQCSAGLGSLDRGQAKLAIGRYAEESTHSRARCYEKLGLSELASGHRRLIDDFYTSEPMALPKADGSSIFRVATIRAGGYERPPSWLQIPQPRYSRSAQRSKIVGRVVIAFELTRNSRRGALFLLDQELGGRTDDIQSGSA